VRKMTENIGASAPTHGLLKNSPITLRRRLRANGGRFESTEIFRPCFPVKAFRNFF
jgi:hypothetical protein